jgi:hypothetical protein
VFSLSRVFSPPRNGARDDAQSAARTPQLPTLPTQSLQSFVGHAAQLVGVTIIGRDAKPERDTGHAWTASLLEARAIAPSAFRKRVDLVRQWPE